MNTATINTAPRTISDKNLFWFFVLAFGITWSILSIAILNARSIITLPIPAGVFVSIATIGSLIAALLVTAREAGGRGVRALIGQCFRGRVKPLWYVVALGLPALIMLAAFGVWNVLGGVPLSAPPMGVWFTIPILIVSLLMFAWFEEIGWRGFAFARLQRKHSALNAALLVGILHASWHLPLWFIPGLGFDDLPFPFDALLVIGLAVIFGWLYNSTGGSLLIVALFHGALNAYPSPWGSALLTLPVDARGMDIQIPVALIVAVVALGVIG